MPAGRSPSDRIAQPSAHDVARLAEVSQATVSRTFTPGASISPAVRERVMRAADTLGYRPNLLARSLIKGKSQLVGVVMGSPRNAFYATAFEQLSKRLSAMGMQILSFIGDDGADAAVPVETLLNYRVEALLLMSAHLSSDLAERCEAQGIPVIFFNRRPAGSSNVRSVTGQNRAGAVAIADHLIDQGYRRLAFVAGDPDSSTSRDREEAFVARLRERGAAPMVRGDGHFDREQTRAAVRALLASEERPDALFCANDDMAIAAIEVARFEYGLEIGRDLGIAGFDDSDRAGWPSFDLTSYSQPIAPMIDSVVTLLTDKAASAVEIEGRLVVRASTRRAETVRRNQEP